MPPAYLHPYRLDAVRRIFLVNVKIKTVLLNVRTSRILTQPTKGAVIKTKQKLRLRISTTNSKNRNIKMLPILQHVLQVNPHEANN